MTAAATRPPATAVTGLTAATTLTAALLGALLGAPPAGAAGIVPPAVPPASIPAPPSMVAACYGTPGAAGCDAAALGAIDAGRAAEGVAPMVLPSNYASLGPAAQLLVLVDLERVDRGLPPVTGLGTALDQRAAQAAAVPTDPTGPPGTAWYSVEATGEPTALAAVYDWMYDDGPGGPSRSCPPSCWGHRNALLAGLANPAMGAAGGGGVWTAVLVAGAAADGPATWAGEQGFLEAGVPPSVAVSAAPGTVNTVDIPVVASGTTVAASATFSGSPSLSLSAAACTAAPGTVCDLQVRFAPGAAGASSGTVSVLAPGGPHPVTVQATSGYGYWQVTRSGVLDSYGGGGDHGSLAGRPLAAPVVGIAGTRDRGGYWMAAADGGVFSFGDARFYGSTGGLRLNQPVVGMAATPDGGGYWLVAADGGIFSFGDAAFHGSTGGLRLNQPVVGMAATADGRGYWLAASDGGIFSFGDAAFHGSTGGLRLVAPVTSVTASPGGGYWEVASDGGVFSFAAPYLGSSAGTHPAADPVVASAAS